MANLLSFIERRPNERKSLRYLSDAHENGPKLAYGGMLAEFKYEFRRNRVLNRRYRQVLRVGIPVFDHPIKQFSYSGRNVYIAHGDDSNQNFSFRGEEEMMLPAKVGGLTH